MSSKPDTEASSQIAQSVVSFALDGNFPDSDHISLLPLSASNLTPAIQALAQAQADVESEIHVINEETADEVSSWVANAKSLQEDIIRSKTLANDIIRQADAPDVSGKSIQDAEDKAAFLVREVQYSQQLLAVLTSIRAVHDLLGRVEKARDERRIVDALHLLEECWASMDAIHVAKSCRAMRLLEVHSFELKSSVHDVLDGVWKALVQVDVEAKTVTIHSRREDEKMTLSDAVIGLKAYKEVEERMEQLWHNLDAVIFAPRTDMRGRLLPSIRTQGDTIYADGQVDSSVDSLFNDLEVLFAYLAEKLQPDLLQILCPIMIPDVTNVLVGQWLDSAIPPSLKDVHQFQDVIGRAQAFCLSLEKQGYSGFDALQNWVDNAPTVWLAKCRETSLDSIRDKLSNGIGAPREVERVEKQMVSLAEGKELATKGAAATTAETNDWDAAWDEDDEDSAQQDEPSKPQKGAAAEPIKSPPPPADDGDGDDWGWNEEDDKDHDDTGDTGNGGDEWGWGDEDAAQDTSNTAQKQTTPTTALEDAPERSSATREMVLRETYHISSMPGPVLDLIFAILEDGAALTQPGNESNPVANAAAGLFGVPTLALALFRGISPYYYSLGQGGSMFLYNDAMYLAERLSEFAVDWKSREDLGQRAKVMLRIDNDVKSMQAFAHRAYRDEMNTQKTVIRDLLGGSDSFLQQDDLGACVDSVLSRIQAMATTWEGILSRSVWYQAVGALVETVAAKIILDVMEMSSIGQDEAFTVAEMIAKVGEIDDIFLPGRVKGGVPVTAQYVESWLRLQYLSEVLQSNLNEVRYLWFESELSLYFSAGEVVDLIKLSFEENTRSREVMREVLQKPHPVEAT